MRRSLSAVLGIALATLGCQPEGPSLLSITDVAPRELELGDRLELTGSGFPEGRPARITFRGDVFKPGQQPKTDVEISVMAESTSPHVITVRVDEELEAAFCGGLPPAHATFRGDITAAFAPRTRGAPPITGTLEGVVVDVQPSDVPEAVTEARAKEAARFAEFLGVELAVTEARSEPMIRSLEPKGRAGLAGLLPGDTFVEIDGLRVRDATDLIPPPRAETTRVSVRRGASAVPLKFAIEVSEFSPAALSDLAPAATLVGIAVAALVLFLSPLGRLLTWFERRIVLRLKEETLRAPSLRPRARQRLLAGLGRAISRTLPLTPFPYLVLIAASAALTLLALGRPIVARELDLAVLFFASATALVASGLVAGGFRAGRGFSLGAGLRRALALFGHQIPLLGGMLCVVLSAHTLRPDDIVRAQGALPWGFFAFGNPALFAAFALSLAALIPESGRDVDGLSDVVAGQHRSVKRSRAERLASAVEWGHLLVTCGLLATLFLGGWAEPLASSGAFLLKSVLGVLIFQVKIACLLIFVLVVRWALCHVGVEQARGVLLKYLLPLTPCALVCTQLWAFGAKMPLLASAKDALSAALLFMCLFAIAYLIERVARELRRPGTQASINPWL